MRGQRAKELGRRCCESALTAGWMVNGSADEADG